MANLIDNTYFVGRIAVAQRSDEAVAENLTKSINQYEPEFLECLLGYKLYKDFLAHPSNPEYVALLNGGDEYTNSRGYLSKSIGLRNTTLKTSPIANYVYYWYMRNNLSFTTGSGEKNVKVATAVDATPAWKMVRAWNEMVDWCLAIVDYLEVKKELYTQFEYTTDSLGLLRKINTFNI